MTSQRRRLLTTVLLASIVAACGDDVLRCEACPGPAVIELGGLQPRPTALQICLDDQCRPVGTLPPAQPMILVGRALFDHSTLTLHTYRNGRTIGTYSITGLTLRRPGGKDCDCGDSIALVPTPDGTLQRRPADSPSPTIPTRPT